MPAALSRRLRRSVAVMLGALLLAGAPAVGAPQAHAVDRPTGPCPGGKSPRDMVVSDIKKLIARHESANGLAGDPHVYVDTKGHPTVGIGFNLDRADARQRLTEAGANYDDVRAGRTDLTPAQIAQLYEKDIADAYVAVRKAVPTFDGLSYTRQAVLVDMMFNLGPGKFADFQKMLTGLERDDYDEAAAQMLNSAWAGQVKGRATELAGLMREGLTCLPLPVPVAPPPVSSDIPGMPPIGNGANNGGTPYPRDVVSFDPGWGSGTGGSSHCSVRMNKVSAYYDGRWINIIFVYISC